MTYQNYEFTAFREEDLLRSGDSNLGVGDTFTMLGAATTCISVSDNDSYLSGDSVCNENSDDSYGQHASIDGVSGGQIYAESYYWVHDQNGNWYIMIEIEQEGGSGDYFTFYNGSGYSTPEAGAELTVHSCCNVTSNWIDFNCLDAGVKPEPEPEGAIMGRVTLDEDCDNTEFAEGGGYDDGIGGLTVKLYAWDGSSSYLLATTTTAADGSYDFGSLDAGWYYVEFEKPDGTKFALKDVGTEHADSDANSEGRTDWICLGEDEVRSNVDASVKEETGSVSGTVFCDTDCDGINGEVSIVPGHDYTIEAEHMSDYGFRTVYGDQASGGKLVKLACAGTEGLLSTTFNGKDGVYDVKIRVQDENDGQSVIKLKVNGHIVEAIRLDADTDGGGSDNGGFSTYVIQDVALGYGDDLSLAVWGDNCEFVRIDKIDLIGEDTTIYTPEPTKAGVVVKLVDAITGDVVAQTETDANGKYAFNDIPVGDYKVMGVAPDGTEFTIKDAGTDDGIDSDVDANGLSDVITVTDGSTTDVDLGVCEKELGSLSGRYFFDANRDGLDNDGATNGIVGVIVELLDADGNGTGITTVTDAGGNYSFTDLEAGTYGVKFTDAVSGKELTTQNVDADASDDIDSDAADIGGGMSKITGIVVVAGADTPDNDAGVVDLPGALSGTYFCDEDRDGVDDGAANGDKDVAGKLVTLLNADGTPATDIDGNPVEAVRTDANGNYRFDNLAAGDYKVSFEDSAAEAKDFVAQDVGDDDAIDSDVDANGMTGVVTVNAGQETTDVDAGVQSQLGALSGRYFCDDDRDGLDNDGTDNGVEGVLVTLLDANGDPTNRTTTTDAQGNYVFTGLLAGTYGVLFADAVSGKELTAQNVGTDDSIDSDASDLGGGLSRILDVVVEAGQETPDNDAGVFPNDAPTATDDAGKGCADENIVVDLSDNYADVDSASVAITMLAGQNIADQGTIFVDGVDSNGNAFTGLEVTRDGDAFIFDGESAFATLDIGEEATATVTFKVEDSDGATTTASIEVTFCGDANSVESLVDSFPTDATYQVVSGFDQATLGTSGFDLRLDGTGDARFDGVVFEQAYCLSFLDPADGGADFLTAPVLTGDLFGAQTAEGNGVFDASQTSFFNGEAASDNMDLINWIIAQDFENSATGSSDGGFNGWEVQFAIWELTDQFQSALAFNATPDFGSSEDTQFILAQAALFGEGFEASLDSPVGLVVDPNPVTPENAQPFIIGIVPEAYDCLC